MYKGLGLLLCLLSGTCNAYIYQVHVLRLWDTVHKRYRYIIGCSDWHDKTVHINRQQRLYLEQLLNQCNRKTTKVIVEDLSCTSTGSRAYCGSFAVDTRGGVLGGLAHACCAMGIMAANIEYRYCRVAALSPAINALHIENNGTRVPKAIAVNALVEEVAQAMTIIQSYADGRVPKNWYQQTIEQIGKKIQRLQLHRQDSISVADYIAQRTSVTSRSKLLKELLTFDSQLLDLKIVHEIINAPDRPVIVIVVGGTHMQQAVAFLQRLGYSVVHASQVVLMREYDLKKCVWSDIVDGLFCRKPAPVDLKNIEQFVLAQ